MNEPSTMVLSKFILLLVLFLLCELGFGPRFRSTSAQLLPFTEVYALRSVMFSSGITPQPVITPSFCEEPRSLYSIIIKCYNNSADNSWHITRISMENQFLRGFIDEEVAQLTYLETLDLSNNYLYGAIPASLGNLSHLTKLDLSSNLLTGSIPPSLGNLKNLTELFLYLNLLDGMIPSSLGELPNLESLRLWSNRLSGVIPGELGNCSRLSRLTLDDNDLIGKLPPELGKLGDLGYLWLDSNNLTGELPKEYEQLKKMIVFAVGGNYLEGPIPKYIANWVNLTRLHLVGNNFQGKLPDAIFTMPSLMHLVVSDLNNTGFYFPKSTNLTSIYTLVLRNCSIMGEIPPDIGNWSPSLQILDLSFNNLSGEIPDSFQNMSLSRMFLTSNMLSGKIPDWNNKTVKVSGSGDLSDNNFTFEGQRKMHTDSEYETFSDQPNINVYPINRTSLYQIGNEGCDGKKLKHSLFINAGGEETTVNGNHYDADNITSNNFYVSQKNHWASICTGYFLTATTNNSDYIRNITCGVSVPEAPLYAKARLCPQSLAYYGFCLRKGSYNVTLHFAEIIFSKDEDHSTTGKRVFDIYIQGNRVLKDFNIKKSAGGPDKIWTENFTVNVGNDHPLEIRLFWAGKGSIYNDPALSGPLISAISVTPNFKVRGSSTVKIVGIVIAAVSALLLLLALFMWRMGWVGDRELRVANIELRGKFYSLKQVKDATGNFHPKNEIGKAQFGIVYKAQLPDKNIVAVKKLYMKQKVERIGTEVYAFKEKKLRHENIVELLDISSRDDLNLIFYEYMERGSLEQVLFDSTSEVQLDWQTRVKLCLGIAKGLNCIHEHGYIHRNVKASNILLDGDLNAKVSDLGLAKLYNEQNPYWFLREIGTRVNTAPEYATRQADTNKADVYSYGIVLLEIVSGKSNSKHEQNQETAFLSNTALVKHSDGKPLDLVDPKLHNNYNRKQAIEILDLAIECIHSSLTLRPTMSEVVNKLEKMLFPDVRDETETENPVEEIEMIQNGDSAAAEEGKSAEVF